MGVTYRGRADLETPDLSRFGDSGFELLPGGRSTKLEEGTYLVL